MLKRLPAFLLTSLLLLTALFHGGIAQAQVAGQLYFPETGHWVSGDFLRFYQANKDALLLYGYPITDAFEDQTTGEIVQYFQRARFELHTDAPADLRVQLAPLGKFLYEPSPELAIPPGTNTCKLFPETGYRVCFGFLDFFNKYGGVAQFGYPISNFEDHDERIVQYFQRARLEYHPEYPKDQQVTLTDLGSRYYAVRGEDPFHLRSNLENNAVPTVLSLKVHAFTARTVTPMKGEQTVYVVVQDQNLHALAGSQVVLVVTSPSGQESRYILPLTDENGASRYSFSFASQVHGLAQVRVQATYNGLRADTVTSFRIWW